MAVRIETRHLTAESWDDYALMDSGDGRKLERYGPYLIDRPDAQALWRPATPLADWSADARFAGAGEDEEKGAWRFERALPERWPVVWNGITALCRCTGFRHVGLFPEHAVHWAFAQAQLAARPGARVLNLFGYTGAMSLACAAAGADVTHIDASPKSIGYGREAQTASGLDDRPVRWICEDALKFVEREARRGRRYEGIVLDPPKFGRGPKNETWKLEDGLADLLDKCVALLSDEALFLIASVYAVRLSHLSLAQTLAQPLAARGGIIETGDMGLEHDGGGLILPTAIYSRWRSA